jgi:hypothetical protein
MPGSRRPGRFNATSTGNYQPNYNYLQTSTRRHEFVSEHFNGNLSSGDYVPITMLRFKRTFDSGNADVPPTPTEGNNYQSSSVFNGSRITNYRSKIHVENFEQSNATVQKTFFLDVYEIALSFFDGSNWEGFDGGALQDSLVSFDGSTSSTNHEAGEVSYVTPNVTLSANNVKNNVFTQKYMRHAGRIKVPWGDSITLNFNNVPPKCRRSNSGMFWGIVLHNDSVINSDAFQVGITQETSFEEIPSETRLPFIY